MRKAIRKFIYNSHEGIFEVEEFRHARTPNTWKCSFIEAKKRVYFDYLPDALSILFFLRHFRYLNAHAKCNNFRLRLVSSIVIFLCGPVVISLVAF